MAATISESGDERAFRQRRVIFIAASLSFDTAQNALTERSRLDSNSLGRSKMGSRLEGGDKEKAE